MGIGNSSAAAMLLARIADQDIDACTGAGTGLDAAGRAHKRMVLRRLKDRLQVFNVAVAEVAYQDVWQRAGLGLVTVASSDEMAEKTMRSVGDEIERLEPGLITRIQLEYLR
jgi:uncharacterized protein YlxP (DUF503 family)